MFLDTYFCFFFQNFDTGINGAVVKPSVKPKWSACVPDSCTDKHLNDIFGHFIHYLNINTTITFNEKSCQSKSTLPTINAGDISAIIFFSIIFAIVCISTVYDLILYYYKKSK